VNTPSASSSRLPDVVTKLAKDLPGVDWSPSQDRSLLGSNTHLVRGEWVESSKTIYAPLSSLSKTVSLDVTKFGLAQYQDKTYVLVL
jgi:hypothetical protein